MLNTSYIYRHWGFTLLAAPTVSQVIGLIFGPNPKAIVTLFELYPFAVIMSILFSLPTLLVYFIGFYILSKNNSGNLFSKLILIAISIVGITVSQLLIGGGMSNDIILAYSISAVIGGILFPIRGTLGVSNKYNRKHLVS